MKPNISPFTIDEYDEVFSLWKRCEGVGLSEADEKGNIRFYLERNPGMSFIARDEDTVIGAILCGHDGRRGYIHHLAVHPKHRSRGIGRLLVERCLSALRSEGIQKCHIFIFNDNQEGVAFWERIGWVFRTDIAVISKDI